MSFSLSPEKCQGQLTKRFFPLLTSPGSPLSLSLVFLSTREEEHSNDLVLRPFLGKRQSSSRALPQENHMKRCWKAKTSYARCDSLERGVIVHLESPIKCPRCGFKKQETMHRKSSELILFYTPKQLDNRALSFCRRTE